MTTRSAAYAVLALLLLLGFGLGVRMTHPYEPAPAAAQPPAAKVAGRQPSFAEDLLESVYEVARRHEEADLVGLGRTDDEGLGKEGVPCLLMQKERHNVVEFRFKFRVKR